MTRSTDFLFSSAGSTHPGRVRQVNQDAYAALPELGVWVVADGVGGHQRGDAASKAVVDEIAALASTTRPDNLTEAVRHRILAVNRQLIQVAQSAGPGTVIGSTVAALVAEGHHCVCLWAGDSRIYGFRRGKLSRLTRDHSQVEELVDRGQLSAAEAIHHPDANVIYRAVGQSEDLDVDAIAYNIYCHDKFMLCTDGLTKELSDEEIGTILANGDCHDNCRALMDRALRGECRDNVGVVVVDVNPLPDSEYTNPTIQIDRSASNDVY